MNDSICSDNVLFKHHFDAIDCQAFTITANFNVVSLQSLIRSSRQDGLRALDRVQEVVSQKSWNKTMHFYLVCGYFTCLDGLVTHLQSCCFPPFILQLKKYCQCLHTFIPVQVLVWNDLTHYVYHCAKWFWLHLAGSGDRHELKYVANLFSLHSETAASCYSMPTLINLELKWQNFVFKLL